MHQSNQRLMEAAVPAYTSCAATCSFAAAVAALSLAVASVRTLSSSLPKAHGLCATLTTTEYTARLRLGVCEAQHHLSRCN